MAPLAVVRGLTFTDPWQVFNRWLMPTYSTAFRWTGNRVDAEDVTTWALFNVIDQLRIPELVEVVDDDAQDAATEAVTRHWVHGYGIARERCTAIYASAGMAALDSLFDDLDAEMHLMLVLRFVRRRSPASIASQLRLRPDVARRRIITALDRIARRIGWSSSADEPVQAEQVSDYIDDLVNGRRPVRFEVIPEAWPAMIAAAHVQAAIAGSSLPVQRFVRSLERRVVQHTERRNVTGPRIWSA